MSRVWTTVCLLLAHLTLQAMQSAMDPRAVTEAIAIGQSRIARDRTRFHAPYRLAIDKPPVDFVEVITPFRRVELVAESRAQIGDRSFGQRQALELVNSAPPDLEIQVELTFHPQNTYVGVPDYAVSLMEPGTTAAPLQPRTIERAARYGPRVEGAPLPLPVPGGLVIPRNSQPLLGGTVSARFDVRQLKASAQYDVVIGESGKELARVRASLEKMR
jgi:hypothetical protein